MIDLRIFAGAGALAAVLACGPAQAQEGFSLSGNLKLGSDYMFRGISQTFGDPQLQGDVTVSHESGLYAGLWSSNTDVAPGASAEFDPFIGFAGDIGESGFAYDVGFWYYAYPGSDDDLDYWEVYGILTYTAGDLTVGGNVWYADNYFGEDFFPDVGAIAYEATASYALPQDFSVSGMLGRQTFDDVPGLPGQDFTYWDIGVSKTIQAVTLDLRWFDADGVQPDLAAPGDVGAVVVSAAFAF